MQRLGSRPTYSSLSMNGFLLRLSTLRQKKVRIAVAVEKANLQLMKSLSQPKIFHERQDRLRARHLIMRKKVNSNITSKQSNFDQSKMLAKLQLKLSSKQAAFSTKPKENATPLKTFNFLSQTQIV